jgi:monovalent cation:proton antiporter-2 (CPA2) family protein
VNDLIIYLLSMVLVVPLSKHLGLGAVIGYLLAGILVGPSGFSLLSAAANTNSEPIAEFGVIMMLMLIGLELNPKLLWKMRGPILGMGAAQVLTTLGVFALVAVALGHAWSTAWVIGMAISVSSTAIVMQTLAERGYQKTLAGERAFAVLLFQDLAIIPMLAVLPLLGAGVAHEGLDQNRWLELSKVIAAVLVLPLAGRFAIQPLFRWLARTQLRETFTALALLIVVGTSALMHSVGLSPALGAFLAGVVLANSEFRHQIEADLDPFKGLLLGLFFITVGKRIELSLIWNEPMLILGWVLAIVAVKAGILGLIAKMVKMPLPEAILFSVALAQGGEFAFVLLGQSTGLISDRLTQELTAAIALTMAAAPLLIGVVVTRVMSRLNCQTEPVAPTNHQNSSIDSSERENPILVIGVGRFGQTLIRLLRANGFPCTVLDIDSEQIDIMAKFGIRAYFGNGTNMDLMHAAGLHRCRALVIAIDDVEATLRIVEAVRKDRPDLPIFARVYDRVQAYKLLHMGVKEIAVETSGSAIVLAIEVLRAMGLDQAQAERRGHWFQTQNNQSIRDLAARFHTEDRESFIQASRQATEQLETMMKADPDKIINQNSPV